MGFKDVEWAYGLDLPSGQKVVLAALCHRTDDSTHQTFVGRKVLAEMVGMTDRGISKILSALADAGVIKREERRRSDGYRDTDLITVDRSYAPSQENPVQMNEVQVNGVPMNNVPISGERGSDLRGTRFKARESKDSLVTQGSLIDHSFERAWVNWPHRVKKKESLTAFAKAAKTRDLEELVADIIRFGDAYAATTEKQYVPALCVWLNGERWTDELPAPKPRSGALTPMQRAEQTVAAGRRISGLQITSLEPGHIPTDAEWNALLADPKPSGTPIPPTTAELANAQCRQHPGYPLINGVCDKCEQIRRETHEAA